MAENSAVWRVAGVSFENRLDILDEAHVEHLVGLVEHHRAHLVELERAALDMVQQPAGRADHHMHAAAERAQLALDRLAAVDRQHRDLVMFAVGVERLGHLHRQLAGRASSPAPAARAASGVELLDDRQREGGRLAGAGLGLGDHVGARAAAAVIVRAWIGVGSS